MHAEVLGHIVENRVVLDVGQKLDVEQMRTRLEASGYRCVDTVYEHGGVLQPQIGRAHV